MRLWISDEDRCNGAFGGLQIKLPDKKWRPLGPVGFRTSSVLLGFPGLLKKKKGTRAARYGQ
jgi:hypothetical protein